MEIKSQVFKSGELEFTLEKCHNPDLGWTVTATKEGEEHINFYTTDANIDDIITALQHIKSLIER